MFKRPSTRRPHYSAIGSLAIGAAGGPFGRMPPDICNEQIGLTVMPSRNAGLNIAVP
jgi:hypothetical protein